MSHFPLHHPIENTVHTPSKRMAMIRKRQWSHKCFTPCKFSVFLLKTFDDTPDVRHCAGATPPEKVLSTVLLHSQSTPPPPILAEGLAIFPCQGLGRVICCVNALRGPCLPDQALKLNRIPPNSPLLLQAVFIHQWPSSPPPSNFN